MFVLTKIFIHLTLTFMKLNKFHQKNLCKTFNVIFRPFQCKQLRIQINILTNNNNNLVLSYNFVIHVISETNVYGDRPTVINNSLTQYLMIIYWPILQFFKLY